MLLGTHRARRDRGRTTVRRLLAAGLAQFADRGLQAVTVDDIVYAAHTSHGTFYLYFANKDDLFGVLAGGALRALEGVADDFPVVTSNVAGRAALRQWIATFCATYTAHAPVLRILSQAELVGPPLQERAQGTLSHLAGVMAAGMTAARNGHRADGAPASAATPSWPPWPVS